MLNELVAMFPVKDEVDLEAVEKELEREPQFRLSLVIFKIT